jgi:hypothetical protein
MVTKSKSKNPPNHIEVTEVMSISPFYNLLIREQQLHKIN